MTSLNKEKDLTRLVAALEKFGPVVLLESQSRDHPSSRKSYVAALPERELKAYGTEIIEVEDGVEKRSRSDVNPWTAIREFYMDSDDWLFGYFGYDLKNHLESLSSENPDPVEAPDIYFMNPGLLVEVEKEKVSILKGPASVDFYRQETEWQKEFTISDFRTAITERDYLDKIIEAQHRITEGDFYEINLSHQMKGTFDGNTLALYNAMKNRGPVPFGAYLAFGELEVCCASPERFLAKEGNRVFSQPIKGTIHRGKSPAEDQRLKKWLRTSEKNRAENLMIVDLVRNDLGRIARKGTVKTTGLFEIQSFGTVHQMVSTVEAESVDFHPVDIIRACFPMGSMTGAPKIRAMKAIEQLEDYRRGIYSGCIGYLDPRGNFDFNVVIRTAIIKGDELFYSVGGAITSGSDPESEWNETLTKARALTEVAKPELRTI